MKRVIAITTVAALFAGLVTGVAYAATQKDFGGPIKDGGTISFGAIRSSGKYTKVGEFVINKIPLKCTGGTPAARSGPAASSTCRPSGSSATRSISAAARSSR